MKLFKTKVWWWLDIGFLKQSSIVIGMMARSFDLRPASICKMELVHAAYLYPT